ncbi:response regulator [Thalassotalea piscium]|uniref:histidine kinase n=1 Tax=Thalassotalea piscium TaxID=1230533 RepID=A0A7X0NGS3_9GAMM|nr:response regulator [Thalassotalea piscium]MBB6543153.1 signal transduction histidine kinase/CheY-like chemotaxis protein [Thalassotalea piscium]
MDEHAITHINLWRKTILFFIIYFVSCGIFINNLSSIEEEHHKRLLHEIGSTLSQIVPFIDNDYALLSLINNVSLAESKKLKKTYIGVYSSNSSLVVNSGKISNNLTINKDFNKLCGLKNIRQSLKSCLFLNESNIYSGYFPMVKNGVFDGFIYIETSGTHAMPINLYNIAFSSIVIMLLPLIAVLIFRRKFFKWLNFLRDTSKKVATAPFEESSLSPSASYVLTPMLDFIKEAATKIREFEFQNSSLQNDLTNSEEQLKITKDKAQQAIESKSATLAQASHDIRSPLHTILGVSELLINANADANDKLKLMSIYEAGRDLKNEVDNILIYESSGLTEIDVSLEETDIEKEVDSIIQQVGYPRTKDIETYTLIDKNVPRFINTYKIAITKIITNLSRNARKFTSKGEVFIKVSYQPRSASTGKLILTVSDTGRGMTKEQIRDFGQKFKQYHRDSAGLGGVGLGLAIVNLYQKAINAQIDLSSNIGKGTTFRVSIDVSLPESSEDYSKKSQGINLISHSNKTTYRLEDKFVRHGYHIENSYCFNHIDTNKKYDFSGTILVVEINTIENFKKFKDLFKQNQSSIKEGIIFSSIPQVANDIELAKSFIVTEIYTPFNLVLNTLHSYKGKKDKETVNLNGLKILSVDDDSNNLRLIELFLSSFNVEITSIKDPEKAIYYAKNEHFDIIIMDIMMPQLLGYQACEIIRTCEVNANTPIIAATATVSNKERNKIFDSGMTDILIKPFSSELLTKIIKKHISKQQTSQTDHLLSAINAFTAQGDIFSETKRICALEKLVMLMIIEKHHQAGLFKNLLNTLKLAFYYQTQPTSSVVSMIERELSTLESIIEVKDD